LCRLYVAINDCKQRRRKVSGRGHRPCRAGAGRPHLQARPAEGRPPSGPSRHRCPHADRNGSFFHISDRYTFKAIFGHDTIKPAEAGLRRDAPR